MTERETAPTPEEGSTNRGLLQLNSRTFHGSVVILRPNTASDSISHTLGGLLVRIHFQLPKVI